MEVTSYGSLSGCVSSVNKCVGEVRLLTAFIGTFSESVRLDPILSLLPDLAHTVYKKVDSIEAEEMRTSLDLSISRVRRLHNVGGKESIPYVLGLAVVKLCSILDELVDSIVVEILKDSGRWPHMEGLAKIKPNKVSLIDYLMAPSDQQAFFLAEELRSSQAASLKVGVGKYECVLKQIGLDGPVPNEVSKRLMELGEVRNVIVHKGGSADARFLSRCPWWSLGQGSRLSLEHHHLRAMSLAVMWYACALGNRAYKSYGEEESESAVGAVGILDELLAELNEVGTNG